MQVLRTTHTWKAYQPGVKLKTVPLFLEIHESAGAYTRAVVTKDFNSYVPTEEEYGAYDLDADLEYFRTVGDSARVAQLLDADASIRQVACYFDPPCKLELDLSLDAQAQIANFSEIELVQYEDSLVFLADVRLHCLSFIRTYGIVISRLFYSSRQIRKPSRI